MQKCRVPTVATPVLEVTRKPASHRCSRAAAVDVLLPPTVPTAQQKEAVIRIAAFAPAANKANRQHVIHVRRAASGPGSQSHWPWRWRSLLRYCFWGSVLRASFRGFCKSIRRRSLVRECFWRSLLRASFRDLLRGFFVRRRCGCYPFPCRALLRICFVRGRCSPCL